jgi:hypothetical protein
VTGSWAKRFVPIEPPALDSELVVSVVVIYSPLFCHSCYSCKFLSVQPRFWTGVLMEGEDDGRQLSLVEILFILKNKTFDESV